MARFFIMGANIADGAVRLTGANAAHAKVLRLRVGDRIIVCDGDRTDHHCTIRRISPEEVEAEVLESVPSPAEPRLHCTILAGLPKQGERSDYIVQKCTECGAAEIVFFRSHRCVATPDAQGMEKKAAALAAHCGGSRQTVRARCNPVGARRAGLCFGAGCRRQNRASALSLRNGDAHTAAGRAGTTGIFRSLRRDPDGAGRRF